MSQAVNAVRKYDENPELIAKYKEGDSLAGERLVLMNQPLVASIAQRFLGRAPDLEELIEIGNIGLVKAINTFDEGRGCAFSTYAVPLIFGEIRRFLRDDGIIKVSREEKRLLARITKERQRREQLGLDTSLRALSAELLIPIEDIASALHSGAPVRSLDECAYQDDDGVTLGAVLFDEDEERRSFESLSLKIALEGLSEFERKLITLRYFRDYSQVMTAEALGVTQVKISREEKKILSRLKSMLT